VAYATSAFRSIELNSVDSRFAVRGERVAPKDLVVVGSTRRPFQALGDERWPFSHDEHAVVVDRLGVTARESSRWTSS
jgi:CHASE2 domain-containing sensor protein